ncbi:MAG: acyltransferase family protein [Planctomycetia bacterium]|nr:acyltransferase family protein [Planctomycetia bacterium]
MKKEIDQNQIDWVFIAKGIGICLVVIGHFHPESSPEYWSNLRDIIYSFHMPLFFLLSGYLYNHGKYSYADLVKAKTKRLLYPFISIAAIFLLIKYAAGIFVKLEHPVQIESIYSLLTNPVNSYMPLLWFVYALFLIFTVYPLLKLYMDVYLLFALFIAINSIIGNDYLVFGSALANIPFFIFGAILRENSELSKRLVGANCYYILVPLLLFITFHYLSNYFSIHQYLVYATKVLIGVLGSIFVINLSHAILKLSTFKAKDVIAEIGCYSMTIYLLHTLFESTVRIGFLQVLKNVQVPFELIAFMAVLCGVMFPFIIEKQLLRKFRATKKFILGIS